MQDRRVERNNKRLTIGLLAHAISDEYSTRVLQGVMDAVREENANLICFPGMSPNHPDRFSAQANVLYDLLNVERVDGLVFSGGTLSNFIGLEGYREFCQRYQPLPMASIAVALEGVPSVVVDNYTGMYEAMTHLIRVHNYRRIAFIRAYADNPEAETRYRAYLEALAEHGLPFDPALVSPPGAFDQAWGTKAASLLLDERALRPQLDLDAIVAPSDTIAMGVLDVCQARGINVPYDLAVTGFDDVGSAKFTIPPLSSVSQPTREQARQAARLVLAQLRGDSSPELLTLPTQLVVRQSCGCTSLAVTGAAPGLPQDHAAASLERRETIVAEMAQAVETRTAMASEWAEEILDAFVAEIKPLLSPSGALTDVADQASGGIFIARLEDVLRGVIDSDGDVPAWQNVISVLRRCTWPALANGAAGQRAENLWSQARVLVSQMAHLAQARGELQAAQQAQTLREIGQTLITTFDVGELMDELAVHLPRLDIPSCYLSLYENPHAPAEWARLILAYNQAGRVELEAGGQRFASPHLVPDGLIADDRPRCFVVEPLYFRQHQIGMAMFEMEAPDGQVYEILQRQISSALQGALLLQARREAESALEKACKQVEEQVEQRTAELQREVTGRQRAQEENLRLQEEIIEAQQQALQELSTPIIPVMDRIIVMPLIGSIDTLRAKDVTRALLSGIREHRAQVVILDVTGVPIVDTGIANHLSKTIQAARLKGARTIVTGMSEAVAETVVDLGVDWGGIETLADLQTGLRLAFTSLGMKLTRKRRDQA
ncbi:MAG: substrate-binding domain-containing protein [Thermoflexales bacterium]|nr:substrate-binding domain-containing protein [Thermoflexales bacterium]